MEQYANDYQDFGIVINSSSKPNDHGEVYITCPTCTPFRKPEHQKEKTLAVNIRKGTWFCQHCGWTGGLTPIEFAKNKKIVSSSDLYPCSENIYRFFEKRKISRQTVDWCGIKSSNQNIRVKKTGNIEFKTCIAFIFRTKGLIRLIKYRDADKNFKIAKESTLIAWGLDNISNSSKAIITEGEFDTCSYVEAGLRWCVSVPNGTTLSAKEKEIYDTTGKISDDVHLNLTWLDNCYEYFEDKEVIYIATDDDPAGIKLRNELGRRLGYHRCKIVKYSNYTYVNSEGKTIPCKDANDVLIHHGPEALRATIDNAELFPIHDVVTVYDVETEVDNLYHNGIVKGKTTGYETLDPHFNWSNNHLITGTGYMNMGKTIFFLNLILLNCKLYNSRWGIYCPENYPVNVFYGLLIEIYGGATLDKNSPERMDYRIYQDAKKFVNDHIECVNNPDGYSAQDLRDLSLRMIKQRGINGFMIDPWNAVNPSKKKFDNYDRELEYELSAEQRFTINTETNRIILAHPSTPQKDKSKIYLAPSYHDIKGGDIWGNKSYEVICIHQNVQEGSYDYTTECHVQKVKNQKETGLRTHRDSPVLFKFVRKSNRFIQPDGYDPFSATKEVTAELSFVMDF